MSRWAALFVLAVALLQGSRLDAGLAELACATEHHEDEAPGSDCPPECVTCACCARVTFPPVTLADLSLEPDGASVAHHVEPVGALPSPPARGILHVPKATA